MKATKCNGCQRKTNNLLTANCGHKTCFQCIKIYRTSNKCSQCANNPKIYQSRNHSQQKQKESRKNKSPDISHKKDDQNLETTTRKHSKTIFQKQNQHQHPDTVYCREHNQPFSMYCQSTKKVICAVCLYKMGNYSNVLPIKNAQDILKRENKIQKQQSQVSINQVQQAYKTCRNNRIVFQKSFRSHVQLIESTYKNLQNQLKKSQEKNKQILTNFFALKLAECDQICSDLQYLHKTLADYRVVNHQNISLNENVFVYESYRIIRKTLKTIDLNYYCYQGKEPKLIKLNLPNILEKINKLITFKLDLPLRKSQTKLRSMSARSPERPTLSDQESKNIRAKSRKDRAQGITKNFQQEFDESLYKKMLRIRFKQS